MRHYHLLQMHLITQLASPQLLFWKRSNSDDEREEVFNTLYDVVAGVYETAANLKPAWTDTWNERHLHRLPPRFEQNMLLPPRTIQAAREMRFARSLLQRHRWQSVLQPLFEDVDPLAWAAMQRRMQLVSAELLETEDQHIEKLRQDEVDWIKRAVEGYDNARQYLRTAQRMDEPLPRQVSNATYLSVHLSLQLSDRLIERQSFEMSKDE
jgi:hypothetical protein